MQQNYNTRSGVKQMSLLSYNELVDLVNAGVIDANPENINGSSIDITLAGTIKVEQWKDEDPVVDITDKSQSIAFCDVDITKTPYILHAGEFCLASSVEVFNLPPNISAEYKLKSTMARNGLEHMNAGWCDPWWSNSQLTLELKNLTQYHSLLLKAGMKIGQVVFYKHETVPKDAGYLVKGQYNGQRGATKAGQLK